MKKNYLLYLCMMICAGVFFTSCAKDDEETAAWQDALGTYKTNVGLTFLLTLDEKPAPETKSVTLSTGTGGSLKVTLTNIVPDNATVEIDNVTPVDKILYYEIAGQTTVGATTIAITGKLSAAAKLLDLKVSRKITSPAAGNWKMSHTETGAAVYANIETSEMMGIGLSAILPSMLGESISLKVNEVWVKLSEDGTFDVTWDPVEEGAATGMPEYVKQIVTIHYFVEDDKVYLALDKALFALFALLPTESTGIDLPALIASITAIGEERGDFVVLPINVKQDDSNHATFYVGKDKLVDLFPLILPMMQGIIPEGILPPGTLELLPEVMASAETFDVGLSFERE
jgi:hypothetical protein